MGNPNLRSSEDGCEREKSLGELGCVSFHVRASGGLHEANREGMNTESVWRQGVAVPSSRSGDYHMVKTPAEDCVFQWSIEAAESAVGGGCC